MKHATSTAMSVYCADVTPSGLEFGKFRATGLSDPERALNLRADEGSFAGVRGRLTSADADPVKVLEARLLRLQQNGQLSQSKIVFGVGSDPFIPFQGKFDVTMRLLKLFERFTPGQLVIQTRSPLLVLAMPVLRGLGKRLSVTMPFETILQSSVDRFMPGLPRLEERCKAARTLRAFNIEVHMQVAPLLPYGDWREQAGKFAQFLNDHADFVRLSQLNHADEKNLRQHSLAMRIAEARQFHYLRPDSAEPLREALLKICPQKLEQPEREHLKDRQLSIFAA